MSSKPWLTRPLEYRFWSQEGALRSYRETMPMRLGPVRWAFFLLAILTVLSTTTWELSWFWLVISAVFVVERTATIWGRGPGARGLAALLIPEIVYDTFIQAVFVKSAADFLLHRGSDWNYVPRES